MTNHEALGNHFMEQRYAWALHAHPLQRVPGFLSTDHGSGVVTHRFSATIGKW